MADHYYPYSTDRQAAGAPVQGQGPGPSQPAVHPGYGQGGNGAPYPPGQGPVAYYQGPASHPGTQYQTQTPFFNFGNDRFLKGVLIGAAAAYLLTNESVQRGAIKGVVKAWSMLPCHLSVQPDGFKTRANGRTETWQRAPELGQTQKLSQAALKPRQAGAGELAEAPMLGIGLLGGFFSRGVGDSRASR